MVQFLFHYKAIVIVFKGKVVNNINYQTEGIV